MLIRNLRLIDGAGAVREGVDVRIRDGRFEAVGEDLGGNGGPELDAGGATAIPGLIDAHTHLTLDATPRALDRAAELPHAEQAGEAARRAAALLAQGVTAARDVGGVAPVILGLRDAVASGAAAGPRILAAGAWITTPGGHGYLVGALAEGEDEVRSAARGQIEDGADLVKLMVSGGVIGAGRGPDAEQYGEAEVAAAVAVAHAEGKRVAAHAHAANSVRAALRGGVDTVEHASFVTGELLAEALERGAIFVPTFAVIDAVTGSGLFRGETLERALEVAAVHRERVGAALRAGVPIAAGTDMGSPFTHPDAIHREIALLADIGMTNHEAIRAATQTGARALGIEDEAGTVEPGRRADLVVLDGDPLADIAATGRVRHLVQDGVLRIRDGAEA